MQRPSFTLIELLIVTAIFALTALLATTVFSNIQSTQRQIQSEQRVSSDGRYILETIARSIRTGTVNYDIYHIGDQAQKGQAMVADRPETKLETIDQNGVATCYRFASNQVQVLTNDTESCPDAPASNSWSSFTPGDLFVIDVKFYINPHSDPFRTVPTVQTDCRTLTTLTTGTVIAGFDASVGACICRIGQQDCYNDMTCTTSGSRATCQNPNVQPEVTIYLRTRSSNTTAGETAEVPLQTTVVSRIYSR